MSKLLSFASAKKDVDMTTGSISLHLIKFAIPLMLGNVFQQLYNTVDTWVVGNYVSKEAFAAVGTVGPIINMLIGFFLGLSSGAGVVISQYYGAKKHDNVSRTVHTFFVATLILGVLFTVAGTLLAPIMLRLSKVPDNVMPQSTTYLTIYFSGIIGLMVYNVGSGILRAVGDSKRPFYFLVCSAVLNTMLDLLFVLVFGMGVEGVALATVIAQCISATLTVIALVRTDSPVKLQLKKFAVHFDELKKIIRVGIPAALQMTIVSFSNVFVQSYINYFGDSCMAGWTAYGKLDQLIFLPAQSLALSVTTFVGQNIGVCQVKRAKKGTSIALLISVIFTLILIAPVYFIANGLVGFFNSDPEVIKYGVMFLTSIAPFNLVCCINQIYTAALRGAGNSKTPMIISLSSFVLFRQVYMFVMANFISNTPLPIGLSYPAGWVLCSLLLFIYYHTVPLDKKTLIKQAD